MITPLQVGTAVAQPGRLAYGDMDAVALPTGDMDRFPVVIAQGREPGPTLWITASIHGNEYTGLAVIHTLMTEELAAGLRGAVVAVPTLNPAGLRAGTRGVYYLGGADPNRLFPEAAPGDESHVGEDEPPSPLEAAYGRLFERVRQTADYLIDLHCASIGSVPFAFVDPVFYHAEADRAEANRLYQVTHAMAEAFGLSVIHEFVSDQYLKKRLHRSVSGAVLNTARIPACTVELGSSFVVERRIRDAAVVGLRNVMRGVGMLDGPPEPVAGVPVIRPGYPIRRVHHPRAPQSCMVHFLVEPGDRIERGQPVAELRDIYGRPVGDGGVLRAEHDGWVIMRHHGAAFFQNDSVLTIAVRDDGEKVLRYSDAGV